MEAEAEHVGADAGVVVGQPRGGVARLGVGGGPRLPRLDVGPLAVEKPQPGGDVFVALLVKLPGRGEEAAKMRGVALLGGQPLAAVGRVIKPAGGERPR